MITRLIVAAALVTGSAGAEDRRWENPVFTTETQALAAARSIPPAAARNDHALGMFLDSTLGPDPLRVERSQLDRFLLSHPRSFLDDPTQRATIRRFAAEVPRQRAVVEARMARFGFPDLEGLAYLRLVASVDAFSDLGGPSSNRMSQVGGVTYYCRYIVLPLSYVGDRQIEELRAAALRNPGLNVESTLRTWQRESFASLVNTFRHELVHVHTNSSIGLPDYGDRRRFPTWFREGTATYLSGDPSAGLSRRYQEYQAAFFYLAERHGVARLAAFFEAVLGHRDVTTALVEVYAITDSSHLLAAGARWARAKDLGWTAFWIAVLAVIAASLRGTTVPVLATLLVLAGVALAAATAAGLAVHLWGLHGSSTVRLASLGLYAAAGVLLVAGVRRILRRRQERRAG